MFPTSLPSTALSPEQLRAPSAPSAPSDQDLVILADTQGDRRNALKFLLEWAGYRVLETGHLAECLAWVHRLPAQIQAVVTAETVGRGKALAARVLAANPSLPVLEFSEEELDATVDALLRPDSDVLTVPPLRHGSFLELVRKALERNLEWSACPDDEWAAEAVA